jgi:DNA-binding HxlR family transcriptional regulator
VSRPADPSTGEAAASAAAKPAGARSRRRLRVGERVLTVLSAPLNLRVLKALSERPMRLAELRRFAGLPAQTTLRGHLASLTELGVLRKRQTTQMPYAVENELTGLGIALLEVAEVLGDWLFAAPDGPVTLESAAATGMVKAFVDGWGSTIVRSLAPGPMSLTELDRRISELSYPALERRLSSMRMAGLVEAQESEGAGTPYAMTPWARRAIAPLGAAVECERAHMRERAAQLTRLDIEAGFLLAMPLVGLPPSASGDCQLEVEPGAEELDGGAGVRVIVERGQIVACDSELGPRPGEYAVGTVARWCRAIRKDSADLLRLGGDRRVVDGLVTGLHGALMPR